MQNLVTTIDRLLRGGYTRREDLEQGKLEVDVRTLALCGLLLGASYGLFMGLFAALRGGEGSLRQVASTMAKVPLLFLLTLGVTFPSLYVFSALADSRLSAESTLRLLLAAIALDLALLSSFGPVTGFFTLSTESYPFMILLNVLFFGASGLTALGFLRRALDIVFPKAAEGADAAAGRVFRLWMVLFGVVGAQMGWILRPFIGAPTAPFELFRARQSNFFVAVWDAVKALF